MTTTSILIVTTSGSLVDLFYRQLTATLAFAVPSILVSSTCSAAVEAASGGRRTTRTASIQRLVFGHQKHRPKNKKKDDDQEATEKLLQKELDLDRAKIKLDAFETYVLVSILTASASFATIIEFETRRSNDSMAQQTLYAVMICVSGISTLLGLYATVIFSLCVLYGNTALGMERDDMFSQILKQTTQQRIRGFRAFSLSLLLFAVEVVLVIYERCQDWKAARIPTTVSGMVALYYLYSDFKHIVDSATPMFLPPAPTQPPAAQPPLEIEEEAPLKDSKNSRKRRRGAGQELTTANQASTPQVDKAPKTRRSSSSGLQRSAYRSMQAQHKGEHPFMFQYALTKVIFVVLPIVALLSSFVLVGPDVEWETLWSALRGQRRRSSESPELPARKSWWW